MGTKAKISGSNKILRTTNNKAANECAPACCSGAFPNSFDVTLSGIQDCGLIGSVNCLSCNGTYTLAKVSDIYYRYTEALGTYVLLECLDDIWYLRALRYDVGFGIFCYEDHAVIMDTDCSGGTSSNELILGDCDGTAHEGYNGSATITGNF